MPSKEQLQLIYIEAIRSKPDLLQYIDDQTEELCILAVTKNPNCITYVKNITDRIKKEFISADPYNIFKLVNPSENDYIAYVNSSRAIADIQCIPKEKFTSKIKLAILSRYPTFICSMPLEEQTIEQINKVLSIDPINIQYVNQNLVTDNELCSIILKDALYLPYIKKERITQEMCDIAVNAKPQTIKFVPECYQTNKLCKLAIDRDPLLLEHVINQTEELCLNAIRKNHLVYSYIKNKNDKYNNELLNQGKLPPGGLKNYSIENLEKLSIRFINIDETLIPISYDVILKNIIPGKTPLIKRCINGSHISTEIISNSLVNNTAFLETINIVKVPEQYNKTLTLNQIIKITQKKNIYNGDNFNFNNDTDNNKFKIYYHYLGKKFDFKFDVYDNRNSISKSIKYIISLIYSPIFSDEYGFSYSCKNIIKYINSVFNIHQKIYFLAKLLLHRDLNENTINAIVKGLNISDSDFKEIVQSYVKKLEYSRMYYNLCTISTIHKIIHEDTIKKLVLKNKAPLNCLQKPDEDFINKVLKKFPNEIIVLFSIIVVLFSIN